MKTREIRGIIEELYHIFKNGTERVNKNKTSGSFNEYVKTLPADKRDMLCAIREFRNHSTHSALQPQLPDNYQEWIELLTNEISKLNPEYLKRVERLTKEVAKLKESK
jgi:hypothetical protein